MNEIPQAKSFLAPMWRMAHQLDFSLLWHVSGGDKKSVAFLAYKEKNDVSDGILNINKFIITYILVYLSLLRCDETVINKRLYNRFTKLLVDILAFFFLLQMINITPIRKLQYVKFCLYFC